MHCTNAHIFNKLWLHQTDSTP